MCGGRTRSSPVDGYYRSHELSRASHCESVSRTAEERPHRAVVSGFLTCAVGAVSNTRRPSETHRWRGGSFSRKRALRKYRHGLHITLYRDRWRAYAAPPPHTGLKMKRKKNMAKNVRLNILQYCTIYR